MKRIVTMCALVGSIAGGVPASAITGDQPEFRKLAEDVYAYVGKLNDSNAMAIVTTEGVVLVDTGNNTTDTRELLKHVQSVTKQPVRYVVITQNHNDHSGGAALFSPPAKTIVHERVAKQWASLKPHQITAWRRRFPERTAALERLNPTDTIQSRRSVHAPSRRQGDPADLRRGRIQPRRHRGLAAEGAHPARVDGRIQGPPSRHPSRLQPWDD
jgi:glyoxylase-like metal-dependent hydrolase (beta-lactamase superfamily II)